MDLQPIEMSWKQGRETLKQYTAILKEKRTAEDIAILKSTKAILAGKIVIRLVDAVKNGGVDVRGLPRIAVARADDKFVKCSSRGNECWMVGSSTRDEWVSDYGKGRNSVVGRRTMAKPRGFKFELDGALQERCEAKAIVPSIPPAHRPAETSYDRYYVLFEAEWDVSPPVDPALLAPLGGGLFVVVAIWDLSDLERAVLANSRGV